MPFHARRTPRPLRASRLALIFLSWLPVFAAENGVIDDFHYTSDTAARRAWEPMTPLSPVSVATLEGRSVLRFPCPFAGTTIERASWDRKVNLELSSGDGFEFKLLCRDATPVSYFSLYFQSGDGWYHATFFPESASAWNTISIDKSAVTTEGRPAGWSHIQTIRISAWRGLDASTEFYLSDLRATGVLGSDAFVAVVRDDSTSEAAPNETRNAKRYCETMAEELRAVDVGCAVVSDQDVTAERLQRAKVVVLPYNPHLPAQATDALIRYGQTGGKILAFYTVPQALYPVLHIGGGTHIAAPRPGYFSAIRFTDPVLPGAPKSVGQRSWNINAFKPDAGGCRVLAEWLDDQGKATGYPALLASTNTVVMSHILLTDDLANKQRMLLALVGYLAPELWTQATDSALARIPTLAGFTRFDQAAIQIARSGKDDPRVAEALVSARQLRASATEAAASRNYSKALDQAAAARQQLTRAFCTAQSALPGEFRAFWCHSAFGVEGLDWDEAARRLAENGFTAIFPNMLWGGAAFYDSQVLPEASQVAQRGDQIAKCLAACRKYGLQIHVWKVNWNLGRAAPRAFVERMRQEGRLQANARGQEELWLCPSHPANQKLEIDSMVEVARRYGVDGIHFDYIRYPDGDHCFCAGCRDRFQQATGIQIQTWPQDVLPGGPARQPWLDWRRANITAVVKAVSEQARSARPGIKLSAAVFPNWRTDRDEVGQDWKLWCEKGYLDFVCPMDYTPSNYRFDNLVTRQIQWAGRTPCYPGIGVSASSSRFGIDRLIEEIDTTRRHQTHGFIIFNYGARESQELLPLLGLGTTRK
jgi:uncharacterized lipoprotein YddW (UPF0748 family)